MARPPLPFQSPSGPLYRIARKPDPWSPPDWAYVGDDGTFGNRFDDADGYFRVLYAGSSPLECFVETLARYRKPPNEGEILAAFNDILNAPPERVSSGRVPVSWTYTRVLGQAVSRRVHFADVYCSEWLSYLRQRLEPRMTATGSHAKQDFDLALLLSQDRKLTQQVATIAYQLGYDGIYYQSRHGTELHNWALFEPFALDLKRPLPIQVEDESFKRALQLLNVVSVT